VPERVNGSSPHGVDEPRYSVDNRIAPSARGYQCTSWDVPLAVKNRIGKL